jgi:hypothetical protein
MIAGARSASSRSTPRAPTASRMGVCVPLLDASVRRAADVRRARGRLARQGHTWSTGGLCAGVAANRSEPESAHPRARLSRLPRGGGSLPDARPATRTLREAAGATARLRVVHKG